MLRRWTSTSSRKSPINRVSRTLQGERIYASRHPTRAPFFPDYALTDHTGKHRTLSELQGPDPMIVVLSRGAFCPKDGARRRAWPSCIVRWRSASRRLVTVSTDNLITTNEYRTGIGAHWPFLSDPARKVQIDLDIAEYTDPTNNPMIPHTIALGAGPHRIQDIRRLLVFCPADHRRASPRPPCGPKEVPAGLGHYQPGTEGGVAAG